MPPFDDFFNANPGTEMDPVVLSSFPWKFAHPYELYSWFNMNITYDTDVATFKAKKDTIIIDDRKEGEACFWGNRLLLNTFSEVENILQLYSSKLLCSSTLVAKEKDFSKIQIKNEFEYHYDNEMYNICCALVVGLKTNVMRIELFYPNMLFQRVCY